MSVPTAFSVVLGTLVIQGLTLKRLLRDLDLHDGDPMGRELGVARERALRAGLASFGHDGSPIAEVVRKAFTSHLAHREPKVDSGEVTHVTHHTLHREAIRAAREAVFAMRANAEIGDDAFHQIEEELDWLKMTSGKNDEGKLA